MLGVVAAQRDELFADGAIGLLALLAKLGMGNDLLHLVASISTAIRISALASVNKRLNASLNGLVSRICRLGVLRIGDVDDGVDLLQLVLVGDRVSTSGAQVEVITCRTMPAGVSVVAVVASVRHVFVFLSVERMAEA